MSLLQEGVAAAKAGDTSTARRLLQKSTELYPQSEMAWFWLAYVSENSRDKVNHLKRVLEINPAQEQARTVLKRALLQSGINSAKAGDRTQARTYLTEAAALDPANELAWMWLASVSENPQEALQCIHKALAINPDNERAKGWLAKLKPAAAAEPQAHAWQCPFCLTTAAETKEQCPNCKAVLSLANLDAALDNPAVKQDILQRAVERQESCVSTGGNKAGDAGTGDFRAHYDLALAYLNLNNPAEAARHLRAACELQPENQAARAHLRALTERLNKSTPPADAPAPEPEARREARRVVLLVDDSPTIRKLVAVTLERQGYRVLVAASGMEALAKLNDAVPDFILLDISMPHMDGYQLCKLIKTNAATRQVPVVMLSGKDGFFDKVRGRMAGANDYLTKPFDPATLAQVIEKHCNQYA